MVAFSTGAFHLAQLNLSENVHPQIGVVPLPNQRRERALVQFRSNSSKFGRLCMPQTDHSVGSRLETMNFPAHRKQRIGNN